MKTGTATQQTGMKQQEFEKLFSEHHAMVYRAAYSVTGNKHEAQEVLQDLFLKLIDNERTLEFTSNPAGYLYRSAINLARERYRKPDRRYESDDGLEPLQDTAGDSREREQDLRDRLLRAMAQLEPEQAELLVLWYEHGYTDVQIGEMLGKTRNAVAVALHRAKARLKELMLRE